jgi:hypothetical protein
MPSALRLTLALVTSASAASSALIVDFCDEKIKAWSQHHTQFFACRLPQQPITRPSVGQRL